MVIMKPENQASGRVADVDYLNVKLLCIV